MALEKHGKLGIFSPTLWPPCERISLLDVCCIVCCLAFLDCFLIVMLCVCEAAMKVL